MADQTDRLADRNGRIWRTYISGRNQEWIAAREGLSQQHVSEIISKVRDALPDDDRADWRITAVETLRHVHAELCDLFDEPSPPAFNQRGDILYDDQNQVVPDVTSRLATVDRLLKVQERAARTLGTDSPERFESAATVHYTVNGVDPEVLR